MVLLQLSAATLQLPAQQAETDRRQGEAVKAKAEAGDAESEYQVGLRYYNGEGLPKDFGEAVKWFRKAAEQNVAMAQFKLGTSYDFGEGVAKDDVEAVKWHRKAAEQNVAMAQANLGACYGLGKGVAKDEVEAYKWFLLAAAQGDEHARKFMAVSESRLTREQIAEGQKLARNFQPRKAGEPSPKESWLAPSPLPTIPSVTPLPAAPADRSEIEKRINALLAELKSPKRDARSIFKELDDQFSALDKVARGALLPQRWEFILAVERAQMWRPMLTELLKFRQVAGRSVKNRPAWEAEPEIGMGNYAVAEKWLSDVGKEYPQDPEVDLWKAALWNKHERWPETLAAASAALAKAKPNSNVALPTVIARANFYKYHALLYQNKLPAAKIALNHALALEKNNAEFKQAERVLAFAELNKLIQSNIYLDTIPLGIYHLFTSDRKPGLAGSLCAFKLTTLTPSARSIRMTVEIPEVTEPLTRSLTLLPGQTQTMYLTPPLKSGFDPSTLRAERPAELAVTFTDLATNSTFFNWSFPVKLLPPDTLPFSIKTHQNTHPLRLEFMGAWVMPNSQSIEQFLTAAKARAPGQAFPGPYGESVPQVKAMFEELKSNGVTYVMDPTVFSQFDHFQRTRLPKEVLASHNAQCLEGSLLFASLMESIGLKPLIVVVPGHAFVGWEPTKNDFHSSFGSYYLETTMVGSHSFEEAMASATARMQKTTDSNAFKEGKAFVVKISELRTKGITPQPYQ